MVPWLILSLNITGLNKMSDFTYFILAMIFNYWKQVLVIILLLVGWSDVMGYK